ncbi:MAG: hypothetical protein ACRYFU_01260 [Janthinobacterium lividum]
MQKVLQSLTIAGILCVVPTATLHAETMGTNPRPRPAVTVSMIDAVVVALSVFFAGV